MDAINSKRSDEKRIAELQEELEKWKPKPQEPEVVKVKTSIYSHKNPKNQSLNHQNQVLSIG